MNDRAYRKFVRDCNRTRFEMFKSGEKAKSDQAQERAQAAKRMKVPVGCVDTQKLTLDRFLCLTVHRLFEIFEPFTTKGF